ncbi:MAG: hypothetical protein P9F75_16550 [Candidatus Contendobacter sp.]|nr:hypothetical protein [Candidatus Contendobacter sp.]
MALLRQDDNKTNGLLQLALKYHHKKRYDEAAWLYQKIIDIYSRFYSKNPQVVEYARINLDNLAKKIENLHPVKPRELQAGDPLLDDNEPVTINSTTPPAPLPILPPPSVETVATPHATKRVMRPTRVTVRVENLSRSGKAYENEFLVDTRAIDCLAPASALQQAGIAVEGWDVYEMGHGEVFNYPYGFSRLSFMGSNTVAQIIFGPEDAEPILGMAALENAGIGIDPVTRTLKRMTAKPLKQVARK